MVDNCKPLADTEKIDIVTRLQTVPTATANNCEELSLITEEAAAEIERLRAEIADWQRTVRAQEALAEALRAVIADKHAEIERVRSEVQAAHSTGETGVTHHHLPNYEARARQDAEEIERLRAEVDLKGYRLDDALDEIDRLNTAMTAILHNSLKNLSIGGQEKVSVADDIMVLRKALDIAADELLLHDEYRSMTQEQIALLLIEKAQSR